MYSNRVWLPFICLGFNFSFFLSFRQILTRNPEKYAFVYCSIQHTIYLILLHFIKCCCISSATIRNVGHCLSLSPSLSLSRSTSNRISYIKCSDYHFAVLISVLCIHLLVPMMCRNTNSSSEQNERINMKSTNLKTCLQNARILLYEITFDFEHERANINENWLLHTHIICTGSEIKNSLFWNRFDIIW